MQHSVTIDCPPEILLGLHLNAEDFADYLKKQAAINLFKEGKLSSGTATAWLGIGCPVQTGDAAHSIRAKSPAFLITKR